MDTGDNERTRRVTILLTPAEYAEVKRRAGLVALGVWIRHTVLSGDALPIGEWRAAGTREPGRKVDEGDQATGKGAAEKDGVEAVQRGKGAKRRPRNNRAKSSAQHGEKSDHDHVASSGESVSTARATNLYDMCQHEYGFKQCPFPGCRNYKWSY